MFSRIKKVLLAINIPESAILVLLAVISRTQDCPEEHEMRIRQEFTKMEQLQMYVKLPKPNTLYYFIIFVVCEK